VGVGGELSKKAELNWDVAWRLAELLRLSGAEVEYTRLQGGDYVCISSSGWGYTGGGRFTN